MSSGPETLLGFDHGGTKIGVAVGQTVTGTAQPLANLFSRGNAPDWDAICELIAQWKPNALVVGLPLNKDGSEQPASRAARRFVTELTTRFGLPVHLVDERYTTLEAQAEMALSGIFDQPEDAMAARLILESWLNEQRGTH